LRDLLPCWLVALEISTQTEMSGICLRLGHFLSWQFSYIPSYIELFLKYYLSSVTFSFFSNIFFFWNFWRWIMHQFWWIHVLLSFTLTLKYAGGWILPIRYGYGLYSFNFHQNFSYQKPQKSSLLQTWNDHLFHTCTSFQGRKRISLIHIYNYNFQVVNKLRNFKYKLIGC
jgi:hypothetical protein